jgi:hypothetical protein
MTELIDMSTGHETPCLQNASAESALGAARHVDALTLRRHSSLQLKRVYPFWAFDKSCRWASRLYPNEG